MVSRDCVGENVAENRVSFNRVLSSCGGVIDGADGVSLMRVGFGFEVGLPLGGEFTEVVPEAGEVAPLAGGFAIGARREHLGGELGGEMGDFVEVTVPTVEGSTFGAGIASEGGAVWSEKRFPLGYGSFGCVRVVGHGRKL